MSATIAATIQVVVVAAITALTTVITADNTAKAAATISITGPIPLIVSQLSTIQVITLPIAVAKFVRKVSMSGPYFSVMSYIIGVISSATFVLKSVRAVLIGSIAVPKSAIACAFAASASFAAKILSAVSS